MRTRVTLSILALTLIPLSALAHTPVEFLEVVAVSASNPVEHGVETKSALDEGRGQTPLVGPKFFSVAVGAMGRPAKNSPAYLGWYEVSSSAANNASRREVSVLDLVRGFENKHLRVEPIARYLLSPSQLITTGAPDPVPDGLDHYKAYKIVDPPKVSMEVQISGVDGKGSTRTLGQPLFLCVANEQWHHDEYVTASHPKDCFVIYQLDQIHDQRVFNTLDQFGLNELRASKSQWLAVRAALLSLD